MNVKELIDALSKCDPLSEVILQKDGEGNGYSPLDAVDANAVYVADSTWAGDVYSCDRAADDAHDREQCRKLLKFICRDTPTTGFSIAPPEHTGSYLIAARSLYATLTTHIEWEGA